MKNLESIRAAGQENINRLVDLGKQQPDGVKTWGVTATAAVVGGVALAAGTQGLLAILATLAAPPVALTVGAIGGGILGWLYMERERGTSKVSVIDVATSSDFATPAVTVAETTPTPSSVEETERAPVSVESTVARNEVVAASSEILVPAEAQEVVADDGLIAERAIEPILIAPEASTESPLAEPPTTEPVIIAVSEPPAQQDNLEIINGIGPVFASRLNAAGIYTFAQLAALTPEQIQDIMASSRGGHMIDATEWIEEARQFANSSQS